MKIVSLQVENFKRLVAVSITPEGNVVQITGKNGAGKTSVLDALWVALAGAGTIQPVPIRKGQKSARVRLDLGELVVTRTFKQTDEGKVTTAITVENAAGARFPSPQTMLDALLGSLSFDPLAFARMAPKDQFNELRRFVPGVDFDAIEEANRFAYSERTALGRKAKEARAAASAIVVPPDAPDVPVDTGALLDELQRGTEENGRIAQATAEAVVHQERAARFRREADEMERKAAELRVAADELDHAALEPVPPLVDLLALRLALKNAEAANEAYRARQQRDFQAITAEGYEQNVANLTAAMQQRYDDRTAAIAAAKLPVPGLGLDEGAVTLDGVPFEQASDAEKLKVSVALAMASNPKLRVIRVRDGSLLDAASLEVLNAMAETMDYQVWIERVDDSGKAGFVIEDGHLKDDTTTNEKESA